MRRWTPFLLGLAASLAVTAILWSIGIVGGALFLFLPFLFWPRDRDVQQCSLCGRIRMPGDQYCPRDGQPY